MARGQLYIYRLADYEGKTLYIGKGSGRRLYNQIARTGFYGEIISRHPTDRSAYKAEVVAIARLRPPMNQNAGGGGPVSYKRQEIKPKWLRDIERIGTRVYAARELLKFDLSSVLDVSKIEAIRLVANGPRC